MTRLRLVLVLAATAVAFPAAAAAHTNPTSRVHNIRHVAVSVLGPSVCGDTMRVRITRAPVPDQARGRVQAFPRACRIDVHDQSWTTDELCRVLLHGYHHLAGYRAKPGNEFVRPDGTLDDYHSRNPRSIMHPDIAGYYRPCAMP